MVTFPDVIRAHRFLTTRNVGEEILLPTSLVRSVELERQLGCGHVYLKPESLQRTGSYKIRGAYYMMSNLSPEKRERGVVTASAGNHAQGVAFAAAQLRIPCKILMPRNAPSTKIFATRAYKAGEEPDYGVYPDYDDVGHALKAAKEIEKNDGLTFIPPFDSEEIVAAQGTVTYEIYAELAEKLEVDKIIVPIGGGGLLAGASIVSNVWGCDIWGIQSEENRAFHDSIQLYRNGNPDRKELPLSYDIRASVADGIRVGSPGKVPFELIKDRMNVKTCLVTEAQIRQAVIFLVERCHLLVEGAGAVGVAALLFHSTELGINKNSVVVVVVSGGNVDLNRVPHLIETTLAEAGRYTRICIQTEDRPGALLEMIMPLKSESVNILDVRRVRPIVAGDPLKTHVEVIIETDGKKHAQDIVDKLNQAGLRVVGTG